MVHRSSRVGPVGRAEALLVEHLRVADQVEHDPAGLVLVGVEGVEHVAEADLVPPDVIGLALPGQEAHPGAVVGVPGVREPGPGHRRVHVEGDGQVEEDHVVLGDGAVVDHGATVDGDPDLAPDPAVGADHGVAQVVPGPEVADGVELARDRVQLRVGGVALGQRPVEAVGPDRVQLVGQLDGGGAGLHDGPGAPGVADDVGVGPERPRRSTPSGCGTTRPGRPGGGPRGPSRRR